MTLLLDLGGGMYAPAELQSVTNPDGSVTVEAVRVGDPFDPCPECPPSGGAVYDTDYTVTPGNLAATQALLPTVLDHDVTLHLSGTYTEPIVATRFIGPGRLRFVGPATITGSVSDTVRGQTFTTSALISGAVHVELVGLTFPATVGHGIWVHSHARVRLEDVTVSGTTNKGITVWDGASIERAGVIVVSGFTSRGIQTGFGARATWAASGSQTLMGTAGAWGVHVVDSSHDVVHAQQAFAVTLTVQNCAVAYACGLNAIFTHQAPGGQVKALTCGQVALVTDCSSVSTNQTFTATGTPVEAVVNSRSHYERPGLVIDG